MGRRNLPGKNLIRKIAACGCLALITCTQAEGKLLQHNRGQSEWPSPWYLKTNLLYDACLMPSLEVEYRLHRAWSVAVEGNMAWWHNNRRHKYYQLATVAPEVRYWLGKHRPLRGHYIGLLAGGGWYDLENGRTGYQGEGLMTGLSYGYLFPIGRHLALEAGIAVGYLRAWHEKYQPEDGHYVYKESKRLDYFGPLRLRLALVWNLPGWNRRKGGER